MKHSIPFIGSAFVLLVASSSAAGCADLTRPGEDRPPVSADSTGTPSSKGPELEEIGASHILVSYAGAARSTQKRDKTEARARLDGVLERLRRGEDFAKLAGEFGEDGTKTSGGDLGTIRRRGFSKPFVDAAFALAVGQTSGVVETEFGFHVIKRTK